MPKGQDDLTRRRRLNNGCCPEHGIGLTQIGGPEDDDPDFATWVECPRRACGFKIPVYRNTKIYDSLYYHTDKPSIEKKK